MESTEPELDHVRILCNQLPREAPKQYQSTHAISVFSFQFPKPKFNSQFPKF